MKKIIYIVSDVDGALTFEWIALGLKSNFKLLFILIGKENTSLAQFLANLHIPFIEISDTKFTSWLAKLIRTFLIIRKEKPAVMHAHLWRANLIGLSAAWLARVPMRIYTRHHATIHYIEYPSGLKWDRLCNELATHIVAISENTKEILIKWDKARERKVYLIPHGFDFNYFENVEEGRVKSLRNKYKIHSNTAPVIGVIARYTSWKGIQYIIPAFKELLSQFPEAHLILANAVGDYSSEIKEQLKLLPAGTFTEIAFEKDLAALYRMFDIYVHTPVDPYAEAFGQTYIESLIAGIPSVFTLSGIARELIEHNSNALVVGFKDSNQILRAISRILEDPTLKEQLISNGRQSVRRFQLKQFINNLENLYVSV